MITRRTTKFTLFFIPLIPVRTRYRQQCTVCGAEYDVGERRVQLLRDAHDRLATPTDIARAVTWLGDQALTADRVYQWIHRGRLIDQGPVAQFTAGANVRVRTPRPDELRATLEREGLPVTVAPDGALNGGTNDAARVGELAFAAGVPLHELAATATSLEEAFLAMTADPPAELTP